LRADTLMQLRLEVGMIDAFDEVLELVDRGGIRYVVLNDHLPHKELAKGKRPPNLTGQALKARRSPEVHWAMLQAMHDRWDGRSGRVGAALCGALAERGVLIGSHDDHTGEDRLRGRTLGASISEFPETREAAETARAGGEGVIMGAPNLVRGGSHAGKVAAGDLVSRRPRGCAGLGLSLPGARARGVPAGARRDGVARGLGVGVGGSRAAAGASRIGGGWSRGCVRIWWWWRKRTAAIVGTIAGGACPTWPGRLAARFLGAGA
jgi:alpha-D-ribose 1-methylphosphonate 5-triphosphate diphosphatase